MSKSESSKKIRPWKVITDRELRAYFTSPVAYIVCSLFLIASGLFCFAPFFLSKRADLRSFFSLLPILFSFFIPALTMRLFSEEKKTGSIETLLTLPVTSLDVVTGKYLAALVSSIVLLVPTLSYVIVCCMFGTPDMGPIIGGYIGAVLLAMAFSAIGVFASSVTNNQIIAFFVGMGICITLTFIHIFELLIPGAAIPFVNFISASNHFESISRGVIDTRDLLYFVSLAAVFFALTVHTIEKSRKD